MLPQRHLARMAPHQGGMAEQGLQLDNVSTGLEGRGGEAVGAGGAPGPGRHLSVSSQAPGPAARRGRRAARSGT